MPKFRQTLLSAYYSRVYPEARFFESHAELRALGTAFDKAHGFRNLGKLMLCIVVFSLPLSIGTEWLRSVGVSRWPAAMIFGLAMGVALAVAMRYILFQPFTRYLREHLQDQGIAVCLRCGYDLRGQSEPRCPECGEAFDQKLLTASKA